MRNRSHRIRIIFLSQILFFLTIVSFAQAPKINNEVVSFRKNEITKGLLFDLGREREELRTDASRYFEEKTSLTGAFNWSNKLWNLQDYMQEELLFSFDVGPFGGFGNWIDSTGIANNNADENFYGIRTALSASYLNRYYYDPKSYTLVKIDGWGRYDLYQRNLDGTSVDSLGVETPIDEGDLKSKFRFGFNAKAGWGYGRLSPMNHLMTAHYLLEKYYPGRIFSDSEIAQFAQVIATLKHDRELDIIHLPEKEMESIAGFVSKTFLLESPELMAEDWQYGEFDPRYEGKRFELGPFFNYYNQEPDFVYGGFMQFDWHKYQSVKWNRNISASITYSRYKKPDDSTSDSETEDDDLSLGMSLSHRDWVLGEFDLGWSYYSDLRSRFDFGLKYLPGLELNSFEEIGSLSHNFIPYFGYFTQLNSKARVRLDFAWRFADNEQFVVPGPKFSVAVYRSRY
ncbi:hypothetical protein [Maribellus sediminis]|uniref:hypothetical protein n=1 Tax=Maribellus sediminis TaxID=2696285 RepID=UPI00142F6D5F|nr:hypothetical protein [Maribellus sediminis]